MAASLNLTQFIGTVGKIETRYLPSGDSVTNLSIAVNDKYKDKSEQIIEHTEWVRISFFGKLSEIAEKYIKKGDQLYVSGQMRTRKYLDKEGIERTSTEIRGDKLQMLGGKSEAKQEAKPEAKPRTAGDSWDDLDDPLPF